MCDLGMPCGRPECEWARSAPEEPRPASPLPIRRANDGAEEVPAAPVRRLLQVLATAFLHASEEDCFCECCRYARDHAEVVASGVLWTRAA